MYEIFFVVLSLLALTGIVFLLLKPLALSAFRLSVLMLAVNFVIISAYWEFGGLQQLMAFRNAKKQEAQVTALLRSNPGRSQLLKAIKSKLQQNPDNPKGWYLLGRLYAGGGDWQKAKEAFATARSMAPQEISYQVNYAQSLWKLNQHVFNEEIRSIFQNLLQTNPKQADALAMLAMDAYQQKEYASAIQYWEKLLTILQPTSKDADTIRQAIAEAQKHF